MVSANAMSNTTNNDLSALTMRVGILARINYGIRIVIGWLFYHVPFSQALLRVLQEVVRHLVNINNAYRDTKQFQRKLNVTETKEALQFNSGFGYGSEFRELEVADHYRQQLLDGDLHKQKTESGALYDAMLENMTAVLQKPQGPKKVLDFGVSYGHIDNVLAKQFPEVNFFGIDRSPLTKFYNEQFFQLPNLHFLAGDIFDCIKTRDWKNDLLFHMRTLTCLPQSFVERFYADAAAAGFSHIVGAEQRGISWQTHQPYRFSLESQASVVFRNYMYIHNYPGLLHQAGYRLLTSRLLKTSHPDPNFRMLQFVAQKIQ